MARLSLPIQDYRYAWKEKFDWLTEIDLAAFAQFGEAAVEPLFQFVMAQRERTGPGLESIRVELGQIFRVVLLYEVLIEVIDERLLEPSSPLQLIFIGLDQQPVAV